MPAGGQEFLKRFDSMGLFTYAGAGLAAGYLGKGIVEQHKDSLPEHVNGRRMGYGAFMATAGAAAFVTGTMPIGGALGAIVGAGLVATALPWSERPRAEAREQARRELADKGPQKPTAARTPIDEFVKKNPSLGFEVKLPAPKPAAAEAQPSTGAPGRIDFATVAAQIRAGQAQPAQ